MTAISLGSAENLWKVFLLFTIPVGGGIPAGVVMAKSQGIGWLTMSGLYFISDILLACLFEPVMMVLLHVSKRFEFIARIHQILRDVTNKTIAKFGTKPGPFLLIMIAFGVDPMTGRAAALSQGHSFLSGWAIAIAGDMLYFAVVMISTIWLNDVLGDGTWTVVIIMLLMMVIPEIVKRLKRTI